MIREKTRFCILLVLVVITLINVCALVFTEGT